MKTTWNTSKDTIRQGQNRSIKVTDDDDDDDDDDNNNNNIY
jgi:hypothetical protein